MSREFVLVLYRSLKAILAAMEREYKLGAYAVSGQGGDYDMLEK